MDPLPGETGSLSHPAGKIAKDFLITATSRMEMEFDILHSPSLYHGELIGVNGMDDTGFWLISGVRVVHPDQIDELCDQGSGG